MITSSKPIFRPLTRDGLSQKIARILTDAIVSGQLKPGDRVVESVIARDHGVSRAPVREAGRLLEEAGLLVSQANGGFFVRTVDAKDLDSLYELRLCIEHEAAASVVRENRVSDIVDKLHRSIDDMLKCSKQINSSGKSALFCNSTGQL